MVTCSKIYESLDKYQKDNYYLVDSQGNTLQPEKIGAGWRIMDAQDMPLTEEVYKSLKEGCHATAGNQLIQEGVNGEHRGGYDVTISYHKSWSVWANSSPENRQLFQDIRVEVSANITRYFESELAQCRYGHDCIVEPIKTGNVVGLRVEHGLSRDGDVQEHDHHVFFNMTRNPETGKWQALQSDAFKNDIIERITENEIACVAQRRGLPVTWVRSDTGRSEYCALAGVPDKAIEVNSTGAQRVDRYVEENRAELRAKYPNASEGELKQYAETLTRPDKKSMTEAEKQERFEGNLASAGLTKDDVNKGVELAVQGATLNPERSSHDVVRQSYRSLQDYESVFSRSDLIKSATALSRGEHSLAEIESAIKELDHEVLKIEDSHVFDNGRREYADTAFTTRDVLQADQSLEGRVVDGQAAVAAIMTPEEAAAAISAYEERMRSERPGFLNLTDSQREALTFLLTNEDRYKAIQGYAGATKTSTLSAYQAIVAGKGYTVIGISESNTAVNEMKAAGIENAYTTTKFLHSKDIHGRIGPSTIILSDETSFTGSLNADRVTRIVETQGARADFWGDKDQLPPISAGHPFHHVISEQKINFYEMKDIRRQKPEQYRSAVYDIIRRDIDAALDKLEIHEIGIKQVLEANPDLRARYESDAERGMQNAELRQLIAAKQREMLNEKIAEIYRDNDGYRNFVVPVATNLERNELNGILRSQNIEAGNIRPTGEQKTVYVNKNLTGIERFTPGMYQPGDKLIAQKAKSGIAVGKEFTVTRVDIGRGVLKGEVLYKSWAELKEIDILQNGDKFLSFEPKTIEIAPGEKIIFNRTDKDNGIANSEIVYVTAINPDGSLSISHRGEDKVYTGEHYEYGYAWTGQRVQGKTAYGTLPVDPRNFQSFYVGATRGEYKAAIVTTNIEQLKENISREVEKEQTWKYEKQINQEINNTQRELGQTIARLEKEPDELKKAEYISHAIQLQTKLDAYRDFKKEDMTMTEENKELTLAPGQKPSKEAIEELQDLQALSLYEDANKPAPTVSTPTIEQSISEIRELAGSDRTHYSEPESSKEPDAPDLKDPESEKELELE